MMLTNAEFDRLPSLLQTIVAADRQLVAMRKPVITIAEAREMRGHIRHRRGLTKMAHEAYGNELKGRDGTAKR